MACGGLTQRRPAVAGRARLIRPAEGAEEGRTENGGLVNDNNTFHSRVIVAGQRTEGRAEGHRTFNIEHRMKMNVAERSL